MKNRIIFFDDFNNIKINKMMEIKNEGYQTYYKKVEDDIIEIICRINFNKIKADRLFFNNNINKYIVVIKEINDRNIDLIRTLSGQNFILTAGMINLNENYINDNCEVLDEVIHFPQLLDEDDTIDIELFIFAIKNRFVAENHKPLYIVAGKEEKKYALGRIPIFILRRFESMQKLKSFHLELYNESEMDMAEISYIEDCIKEYIEDDSLLKIDQSKKRYDQNNTYFLLSAQ